MRRLAEPLALSMRLPALAMAAIPWWPFVVVGRQPYSAPSFAARIRELEDLTVIDGSWARPAHLAVVASVLAGLAALSWGRAQQLLTLTAGVVGLVAATLGHILVLGSDLLSAGPGMGVLLLSSVAGLGAAAAALWGGAPEHRIHHETRTA